MMSTPMSGTPSVSIPFYYGQSGLLVLVILEELPEELDFGHPFEPHQEKGKKLTNIKYTLKIYYRRQGKHI